MLHLLYPASNIFQKRDFTKERFFFYFKSKLRILTRKKHPEIKLQRSRKIQIFRFGSLVHQINYFQEVLKPEQIFQKN